MIIYRKSNPYTDMVDLCRHSHILCYNNTVTVHMLQFMTLLFTKQVIHDSLQILSNHAAGKCGGIKVSLLFLNFC